MKPHSLKTLVDVHAWVGLIAGFALFIAFYAGAITVFTHELNEWDDFEAWNVPADPIATTQQLVDAVMAAHPGLRGNFYLQLPGERGPHAIVYWYETFPDGTYKTHEFRWQDGTAVDNTSQSQLAAFIYKLHYTAGIPGRWGINILGFVCILYGVALVTGIIMYAPMFVKDLFALRAGGSPKRFWQDAHNVIGVLSLPFHAIFAWSGAVLCIGTLLLAPFQFLFEDKLMQIIDRDLDLVDIAAAAHTPAPSLGIAELLAHGHRALPGVEVESMGFSQAGDASAQVTLYGTRESRTVTKMARVALDANDGRVLRAIGPEDLSAGAAFYRGLASLHFGNFGHTIVKWLYFILGMAGAFLFYSGNLLWVEARRKRRSVEQTRSSRTMAQVTLGVCLGCIAGISAAIVASRALPRDWERHATAVEWVYYAVFLASVGWALIRKPIRAANELLIASAAFTVAIPMANAFVTGMGPWRSIGRGHWAFLSIDVISLVLAWMFLCIAKAVRDRGAHGDPHSVWAR